MKRLSILFLATAGVLGSCADTEINTKKQTFPYTTAAGEYSVALELTGGATASDFQHILLYNTAAGTDSLWIEDRDFFESKVKVLWDGKDSFSITNGDDVINGEVVNINGQVYPEKDSIHVVWTYLQGTGDPNDDYVVVADGRIYDGMTN